MRCPWSCRRLASLATVLFAVLADDPELRARLQITFEDETQANASVTRVLELTGGTPLRDAALGFCAAHGLNATRHVGAIETALVQELERMKHAGVVELPVTLHHTNGSRSVTTIVLRPGVSSRATAALFGERHGLPSDHVAVLAQKLEELAQPAAPSPETPVAAEGDQPRAAGGLATLARVAGALLTLALCWAVARAVMRGGGGARRPNVANAAPAAARQAPAPRKAGAGAPASAEARLVVAMAEQVEASVEDAVQRAVQREVSRALGGDDGARAIAMPARGRTRSSPSRSSARSASMQPQPSPSMAPSRLVDALDLSPSEAERAPLEDEYGEATDGLADGDVDIGRLVAELHAREAALLSGAAAGEDEGDESARLLEQALALQRSAAKVSRHIQQKDIVRRMRGSSVPAGVLDMAAAAERAERFEAVEHVERVPVQPRFGARAAPSAHKSASPSLPSRVGDDSSTVSSSACDAADSDEEAHIEDEYREIWRGMGNGAGNGEHDEADFQRWYKQVIGPQLGSR